MLYRIVEKWLTTILLSYFICLFIAGCHSFHYWQSDILTQELDRGVIEICLYSRNYLLSCNQEVDCLRKIGALKDEINFYSSFKPDEDIEYCQLGFDYAFHENIQVAKEDTGLYFRYYIDSLKIEQIDGSKQFNLDSLLIRNGRSGGHHYLTVEPLPFNKSAKACNTFYRFFDNSHPRFDSMRETVNVYSTI